MFTIVLLEPQIPPNTGSTGRLCGATNTNLHIVGNLGFELSDKTLKRAGLDYWKEINWEYFPDINSYLSEMVINDSFHLLTTKSSVPYTTKKFKKHDFRGVLNEPYIIEAGLIAQEVEAIPNLEFSVKKGTSTKPYAVNYNNIFVYGLAAIKELDDSGVDAIIQVGTNLACSEVAAEAEKWLQKPVIAINAATYWHSLRRNGFNDKIHGHGRLLEDW